MAVAFQHRQGAVFIAPEAECRGLDPAMFFPEEGDNGGMVAAAKAVCAECVERDACLAFALEHHQPGIWGGLTDKELRTLRRMTRRGTVEV